MRILRALTISALALGLFACGGAKISTDYAPNADFSKYRTYAWHPNGNHLPENPRYASSLLDSRLMNAVDYAMGLKGMTKVDADRADLLLVYHAIVDSQTSYTTVNNYYGYNPYWGGYGRWGAWGGGTTYVNEYDEGTFILDMLENVAGDEDRIVWRGMITDQVKEANSAQAQQENLRNGAVKLLADFPPGGQK